LIKINIIAVGKLKEKFWVEACGEYIKRMPRYFSMEIIEVPDYIDRGSEEQLTQLEAPAILSKIKGKLILLDKEGESISSEGLSEYIQEEANKGISELSFVIGGSRGVSPDVKNKASKIISFGKITFPHQLMRVVLLEQIYRAGTIMKKENYHK
jgi:23S rRNA (pseudouridine1915-N3)-methyltransferase